MFSVYFLALIGSVEAFPTVEQAPTVTEYIHMLQEIHSLAKSNPQQLLSEIESSGLVAIAPTLPVPEVSDVEPNADALPVVVFHGMGDSCFNPGMKSIAKAIKDRMGSEYGVCIPTGGNVISDTLDGFLMTMEKNIDVFAKKVQADPKLANGFVAAGTSQGNSVIAGYILKYNNPPVKKFLSIHGTVMGVSAIPQCNPNMPIVGGLCKALSHLCGDLVYNSIVQGLLFQADYFRDPTRLNTTAYMQHSQLAALLNENGQHPEAKTNFGKTELFAMVKADGDTMIFPNAGEWWGGFADNSFKAVDMKQLRTYQKDEFGLQTADKAGKIHYEQTSGNHLQFTIEQLNGWVDKYFK